MSDNIAVMNHGRFEQIGTPHEVYHAPATAFVAGFVGDANKITAQVDALDDGMLTLKRDSGADIRVAAGPVDLHKGQRAQVFLRPEAIELLPAGADAGDGANVDRGVVDIVLFNGANSTVTIKSADGTLLKAALPQTGAFASLKKGDPVSLRWQPTQARCYPAAEG